MQWALDYLSGWSKKNAMNLNEPKTKFMEIKFSFSGQAHLLILKGDIISCIGILISFII